MSDLTAFAVGVNEHGQRLGITLRRVDGAPELRIGPTAVTIRDPKALMNLAGAFAELADEAAIAADAAPVGGV